MCIFILPAAAYSQENTEVLTNSADEFIDVDVPVLNFVSSPLVGNAAMLNAFFNPGQTEATTNLAIFDWRNISLPANARVTKVEVSSIKTNVAGMTYYVRIGKGSDVRNINWAPNIIWASKVNTSYFNNQDPHDYWALSFYARRVITNPMYDYGAGATVRTATLRVYYR